MKSFPAAGGPIFAGLILVISLISCSPKHVVQGRVVDAATQRPIPGAAVAIRWYTSEAEDQSTKTGTIEAVQSVTDARGIFKIPKHPDTNHVLGVYKNGYICWSSQDIFIGNRFISRAKKYRKRKHHRVRDGMEIKLESLQKKHPKEIHAGFTVMVAGENTNSESGPFHQAIQSEYQLWRENLRKDFQKQVGAK
ncbi:hypothetical protein JY97_13325 [Alkalispirochaeta odontotermitis]|nr:hypothetical protein JY97_13325 [Alkalispirochaeta odontotermitis]